MRFRKQRILALVLVLALCMGCVPAYAANAAQHYGSVPIWLGDAAVDYQAEQILKEIPTAGKSPTEQIRAVYDWIILHCERYDWDGTYYFDEEAVAKNSAGTFLDDANAALEAGTLLVRTDYAWDFADDSFFFFPCDSNMYIESFSYDMMLKRTGNCAHYAALLTVLLGHLGFDCRLIDGEFINNNGSRVEHKWNYVLVDGAYYWLDPRMDHANYERTGKINYYYFMKADTAAWAKSHAWDHTYSDWLAANAQSIVKDYNDELEYAANRPKYTVTAKAQGKGTVSGGGTYAEGETVKLTAQAGANAVFDGWYDAQGDCRSTDTAYQFTSTENVELTARFITLYRANIQASRSGTVSGAGQYQEGEVVSLEARPASGHTFEGWYTPEGELVDAEPAYSFPISEDVTLYAMFSEDRFVDVPDTWYTLDAMEASEAGYVTGSAPFRFEPGREISRAEVVTLLARLDGVTVEELAELPASGFTDAQGTWSERYINWATAEGIVNGRSETLFDPNASITRQETTVIFLRYLENKLGEYPESTPDFVDADEIAPWAVQSVGKAYDVGLVSGAGYLFMPKVNITRAETVTMLIHLARLLGVDTTGNAR